MVITPIFFLDFLTYLVILCKTNNCKFFSSLCSNHAWVSFHGFSESYNEYTTETSSSISENSTASKGLYLPFREVIVFVTYHKFLLQ